MVDGRHTGTGGGNHVVLGEPNAADSPFLRRPDLLKSLVALYWQRRPSLSYLFSCLFIGTTTRRRASTRPGRMLYELEIAFANVPAPRHGRAGAARGWLTACSQHPGRCDGQHPSDRNLHRQAVSPKGRARPSWAGRVPAHSKCPRMRASFSPSSCYCARWSPGSGVNRSTARSHAGVRRCMTATCWNILFGATSCRSWTNLRRAGYNFDSGLVRRAATISLPALWHRAARRRGARIATGARALVCAGRRGVPGNTVRIVDSSVERLQVKVQDLRTKAATSSLATDAACRFARPAGRAIVGGVRYKAWDLPSALHPTVEVHAPLTFDIIDSWSRRSLGGCVYHVAHPGGRNYETFPVNSYEAEARRRARFQDHGHTGGLVDIPPVERSLEFPTTLDLRRPL